MAGAEEINLSFSGFDQSEACWITRLLRALGTSSLRPFLYMSVPKNILGINLAQFFSKRSTHLLCPSRTGAKFEKALEWGIPVVGMEWLVDIASRGTIPPAFGYLMGGGNVTFPEIVGLNPQRNGKCVGAGVNGKNTALDKGKGRERATDIDTSDSGSMGEAGISNGGSHSFASSLGPSHDNGRSGTPPPDTIPSDGGCHLERQNTVLLLQSPKELSFGKPSDILGHAPPPHPQYHPPSSIPPGSNASSVRQGSLVPPHNSNHDPARKPTPQELEHDRKQTRIPSSKSPSPMKIPRQPSQNSLSPAKIDTAAAKALQESITSLLGKRPPEEENPAPRVGKRTKPYRSKVGGMQTTCCWSWLMRNAGHSSHSPGSLPMPRYQRSPRFRYLRMNLRAPLSHTTTSVLLKKRAA